MDSRQRQKAIFFILVGLAVIVAVLFGVPDPWRTILLALGPLAVAAVVMFPARQDRKTVFFALVTTALAVTLLYLGQDWLMIWGARSPSLPTPTAIQAGTVLPPVPGVTPTARRVAPGPILTMPPTPQGLIAFVRDGSIWVTDTDGRREKRLTEAGVKASTPAWGPQKTRRLAYAVEENGTWQIWTMWIDTTFASDIRATAKSRLTRGGGYWPTWSPDGKKMAYQSKVGAAGDIMVMWENGSNPRRLTDDSAYDGHPAWSPDGQYIAFASDRTGTVQIWLMEADGSSPRQLTKGPSCQHPAWSPDGRYLAYEVLPSGSGAEAHIYVADVRSGKSWDLGQASFPAWSPDGVWIAYKNRSPRGLWLMQADGSAARRVLDGDIYCPVWAPR